MAATAEEKNTRSKIAVAMSAPAVKPGDVPQLAWDRMVAFTKTHQWVTMTSVEEMIARAFMESGPTFAWAVRPKGSDRPWTLHLDEEAVAFYRNPDVDGGPYDVVELVAK